MVVVDPYVKHGVEVLALSVPRYRPPTTFLGRLLRVDLITLVGLKCPSIRPQKVSSFSMKFGV